MKIFLYGRGSVSGAGVNLGVSIICFQYLLIEESRPPASAASPECSYKSKFLNWIGESKIRYGIYLFLLDITTYLWDNGTVWLCSNTLSSIKEVHGLLFIMNTVKVIHEYLKKPKDSLLLSLLIKNHITCPSSNTFMKIIKHTLAFCGMGEYISDDIYEFARFLLIKTLGILLWKKVEKLISMLKVNFNRKECSACAENSSLLSLFTAHKLSFSWASTVTQTNESMIFHFEGFLQYNLIECLQ
jgi:hypothetical protein